MSKVSQRSWFVFKSSFSSSWVAMSTKYWSCNKAGWPFNTLHDDIIANHAWLETTSALDTKLVLHCSFVEGESAH